MALSSLVPATVNSLSLLAKSPIAGLQVWSLHGLLLTIEAAGLSFVSHVQVSFFFYHFGRLTFWKEVGVSFHLLIPFLLITQIRIPYSHHVRTWEAV